MSYWLMKTEPSTFSIDDLAKAPKKTTGWDGVRNFQARNMLRDQMKKGDEAFLYYSSTEVPGIVGVMEITKEGYPDPTAFDRKHDHYDADSDPRNPRWFMVDVKLKERFPRIITLAELRAHASKELAGMVLLRPGNRLSVMPVAAAHWKFIRSLL
ncbi:MAG TPA: EVE domain-containing protein [Steroidobacteraceae bacterium]|jgi:predicted RNA-binding protein with PUA-like domain|nr:EVE domain-containing protein [Steroidobacteraceae bacterium]